LAQLSTTERINIAYKMTLSVQGTANTDDALGRNYYEEPFPWIAIITGTDVIVEPVPYAAVGEGDVKQSENPTIISKVDMKLTKKSGYNERLWGAHSTYDDENSNIYSNFLLPQRFGPGYTLRLYEDDGAGNKGNEITTTEGAWIFSYKGGLLILGDNYTASDMGWTEPLHIVGYRYIGDTLQSVVSPSLDDAYNNGRYVDVDEGPVELDATPDNGNKYAPLRLTNLTNAPSSALAAGDVAIVQNRLWVYDGGRSKWLSVHRDKPLFGKRRADGMYLNLANFSFVSRYIGFIAHIDATIVSISAKCDGGYLAKTIRIRRNALQTDLFSFSLSSGNYLNESANININAGDYVQVFADPAGTAANNLIVQLEIAYRLQVI